nr:probable serine/threonine-protein kinase PBL20 [Quercus suber]
MAITMNKNAELVHFRVEELTQYTNNFANQLGQSGGFGSTFRGMIPENNPHNLPGHYVAVKRSHFKNTEGIQQYETEKLYLGMLHHPNVVLLIGFSESQHNLFLVYELLEGETLKAAIPRILMPYNDIYALGVITIQLITKRANVIGPNYKHVSTIAEEEYKESGHVLHETLITSGCNQLEAKRITKLALSLTAIGSHHPTAEEELDGSSAQDLKGKQFLKVKKSTLLCIQGVNE